MKKDGFTLIELAISLVIISLIAGGVLVGRDMIRMSELRNINTTIEQYKTATYTFKTKYNALPGDATNATNFFAGSSNGNGNGLVDTDVESVQYWMQLGLAGLISGTYNGSSPSTPNPGVNVPGNSKLGYIYRCSAIFGGKLHETVECWFTAAGWDGVWSTINYGNAILTSFEARSFDLKFDDGTPIGGKIFGTRQSAQAVPYCTDLNVDIYNPTASYLNNDLKQCVMHFEFQ